MNIPLLRKIQKRILAEPKHFDMAKFFSQNENRIMRERKIKSRLKIMNCNTTACIAGWACVLSEKNGNVDAYNRASKILNLKSEDEANELFFISDWINKRLSKKYIRSVSLFTKAKVASQYIDFFIKHYSSKRIKTNES